MKIVVYGKPQCVQCEFTKNHLNKANVSYEYIDVTTEENEKYLSYIKDELGFSSLPVVEAEGYTPFAGFTPNLLNEIEKKYKS